MPLSSEVEIVHLQEKMFVGIPVTSSFANHDPRRIDAAKHTLIKRLEEIRDMVNPREYVCLSFVSETLFTYLICMEVNHLAEVPDGMIGFAVPEHTYGRTRSEHDPYDEIHAYLKQNGMNNNKRAMALEVYTFENPQWPDQVDVYIPIESV